MKKLPIAKEHHLLNNLLNKKSIQNNQRLCSLNFWCICITGYLMVIKQPLLGRSKLSDTITIAIAGAFGFVGKHLIQNILEHTDFNIIALSRTPRDAEYERVECRTVDLYSLKQSKEALSGCDIAVYLVHSMAPNSRLSQGNFRDFDFILADNFARAAKANGVKKIIYVGGLIPAGTQLSEHLESRLEVEHVLKSYSVPLVAVRCALIIGPEGSSYRMIARLVKRLPIMILPQWMNTHTNPIYVEDVAKIIIFAAKQQNFINQIIDAGIEGGCTYKDIVIETAKNSNKDPWLINFPYVSPHLSKLWIVLVTRSPKDLVYPLIESVRHEMLIDSSQGIPKDWGIKLTSLQDSVRKTFKFPCKYKVPRLASSMRDESEVRSVQRMPLPKGKSSEWICDAYFSWMPLLLRPFIRVENIANGWSYRLQGFGIPLLNLIIDKKSSTPDRQLLRVVGGVLVAEGNKGRFEFRESVNKEFVIVALHNFKPALPWLIYKFSQALIHKIVMQRFCIFISKKV